MKFIQIFKDGKMDEINLNDKDINEKKVIKFFNKISKSQGSDNIQKLYYWKYDNFKIMCYGWYDGEDGFENNHDLPKSGISNFIDEDSSIKKLYGDIFILKQNKNNFYDINIGEYSVFYSSQIEDYSDYESDYESDNESDNESENYLAENYLSENEYDNNNNNNNNNNDDNYLNEEIEIKEIEEINYLELEYDNNEY